MPLRLGALDKVSLEADEKTEIEREKQVQGGVVSVFLSAFVVRTINNSVGTPEEKNDEKKRRFQHIINNPFET